MREIVVEESESEAVAEELGRRLREFNEVAAGALNGKSLVLSIRNDAGEIIAGLSGDMFWNAIYVELLWVHEQFRGEGYGRRLMEQAEAAAIEHGCDVAYLTTFSFQAPVFYERLGYRRLAELANVPRGESFSWMYKSLSEPL